VVLAFFIVFSVYLFSPASAQLHPVDADANRTMCEIITSKGYPCEEHYVTTQDGYILGVFRMPNKGPPVFLQHGLEDSSFTWVLNYPDQSLSYILYNAGYDVWFGNNRGNTYSKNHTTLSPDSNEFWKFSWDQMAMYDFPAQVSYALQTNGLYPTISYIGHSEGTTQAFGGLSLNSSIAEQLNLFVGFGPLVTVVNMTNRWLKDLAESDIIFLWNLFGINQFFPTPVLLHNTFIDACADCEVCCNTVIELICGIHIGAFNNSRMPVMAGHEPGGTSVQNVHHWIQMITNNQFEMMDFGRIENEKRYGQRNPPVYNLENIPASLPLVMYSGSHDVLADPVDVQRLMDRLALIVDKLYWKEVDKFAHLDYVWALDASDQIYSEVLTFLSMYAPIK